MRQLLLSDGGHYGNSDRSTCDQQQNWQDGRGHALVTPHEYTLPQVTAWQRNMHIDSIVVMALPRAVRVHRRLALYTASAPLAGWNELTSSAQVSRRAA